MLESGFPRSLIMTKYIFNLLNRARLLLYKDSLIFKGFLNIISIIFCICLFYYFVSNLHVRDILPMIFAFVISFLTNYFIFSKLNYSKNWFISFMQKSVLLFILFVILNIFVIYFGFFGVIYCSSDENYHFDVSVKGDIPKKPSDDLLKIFGNILSKSVENLGATGAGATAAGAMIKATVNVPPFQRLGLIGGSALMTSAGVLFGIRGANAISNRLNLIDFVEDSLIKSPHSNTDVTRVPSPGLGNNINSPLEIGDMTSPLTELLDVIFSYNVLELILILLLLYVILYKFILNKLINYIPSKYTKTKIIIDKSININSKFMNIMLGLVIVLLLIFKLINLFFSYELSNNIESYVSVHNYLNKKSLLMIISLNNSICNCKTFFSYNSLSLRGKYNRFNSSNKKRISEDKRNIDIISKIETFGSYDNYLREKVTLRFIEDFYPNYSENELFIYFINELPPSIRYEKETINKLFELIINLNTSKDKLMLYSTILPKDVLLKLFKEVNIIRKDIFIILETLNFSHSEINKLLLNLGSKLNSKILNNPTSAVESGINVIENSEVFMNSWYPVFEILSDKLNLSEEIINIDKNLFIDIINLIQFCITNKIGNINSIEKFNPLNEFNSKLEDICKSNLTTTVKTRKKSKVIALRPGAINSNIKFSLIEIKSYLEDLIKENILTLNTVNTENLKSEVTYITDKYTESFNKDYNYILNNYTKALGIMEFLFDISKDLSDSNINSKYDKFIEYIYKSNMTIDDLYYASNLFNSISSEDMNFSERQNTLNIDSNFFVKCKNIISDSSITDNSQKQIILERFILNYEKDFILNLINNIDHSISNYKLLSRIYKHSTPHFNNRINTIITQHLNRNLELYNQNRSDIGKIGDNLALALFLVLDVEDISNILFSKVIRIIGNNNGVKQTQLIGQLADEMCITFKHNSDLKNLQNKLTTDKFTIVKEVKDKFNTLPIDSKLQFGHLLFDLLISEFSYIFERVVINENNESHIYLTISKEYLQVLSGVMFNPIKLPMLCKPKEWTKVNIGGYLLDEFNELNKNNEIVRSNPYLRNQSIISESQITTVNYLNSIGFVVNSTMLHYLVSEWKTENSLIFKNYNKLHPLTNNINENIDSKTKIEILQHNSLYWNYSNIINIALLMEDQTIYLPTFLDFRGRIYPTPNYLSYQGGDIARSLLLFKKVGEKVNYKDTLSNILDSSMTNELTLNKLNDIDYVKLYVANVYGLNKLNRINRIKWFDSNITEILYLLENNIEQFNNTYLINAKEPAQFISSLFEYNKYIKNEINEIKTPILFDATCSGIQHLSALTTDLDIAKLVNLIESIKDEPSDFYEFCIKNIRLNIVNLPEEDSIFKNKLIKLDLNRKMLKHSIMTVPYNVTPIGIADKLAENFERSFISIDEAKNLESNKIITLSSNWYSDSNLNNSGKIIKGLYIYKASSNIIKLEYNSEEIIFTQRELNKLGNIIRNTVLSLIPPFANLKDYFDKMIDVLKIINLPIYWETPSNMTVSMSIMTMTHRKIKTRLLKSSKPITILLPSNNLDYTSIKTGLMPNFIHSLDASNIHILIKTILLLKLNNINLYTIHDCFATDYKNMAVLEVLIKKSFADIYFNTNYLNVIHNSFISQINSITTIFEEDNNNKYILIEPKLIKNNNKNLITNNSKYADKKFVKLYLPKLPEYKWSVNKDLIRREIMFNQYFIS